ncbi:Cell division protein FtsW [gamma proteobacterium HdN1]|nr:Cell division protein FtsW [gamma proteobacterium HdN1]
MTLETILNPERQPVSPGYMRIVLLATLFLASTGFVIVSSASMDVALRTYGTEFYFVLRHLSYLGLATLFGALFFQIRMETWQRYGGVLLVFSYVLLVLVLLPGIGRTVNGSTRWIPLGIISVQVSEIAKIGVLCYVAGYLVRRNDEVRTTFVGFIKPVAVLSLMVMLLLAEPDFGAVVVIMGTVFVLLFLAGVRFLQFALVLAGSGGMAALMIFSSEYRMKRMLAYVNPWDRATDDGYQLVQSLIAFGRGEIFGVGLGNSVQKLFYLPEAHTDFVFAILAEEFGLVGCTVVILAFLALVLSGMFIGRRAERMGQTFSAYLAYGISIMLGLQSCINIGVVSGMLPTKGLTLPLISYGGSSLIVSGILVALLLRVDYEMRNLLTTDPAVRRKLSGMEKKNGR